MDNQKQENSFGNKNKEDIQSEIPSNIHPSISFRQKKEKNIQPISFPIPASKPPNLNWKSPSLFNIKNNGDIAFSQYIEKIAISDMGVNVKAFIRVFEVLVST